MSTIDKETATQELIDFLESMDIDTDVDDMEEADAADFNDMVKKLSKQIQKGRLVFNDDGWPVYTPAFSGDTKPIEFKMPKGDLITSGDAAKKGEVGKKYQLMLAKVTRKAPNFLAQLDYRDWKVCSMVASLFFA